MIETLHFRRSNCQSEANLSYGEYKMHFPTRTFSLGFFPALLTITGCSMLTRPIEKPVIEDNLRRNTFHNSHMGILSLSPERRAVLYNFVNQRYCAENPTEVGIDMASAAKLAASLKEQKTSSAVEAALALSAASNNFVLNRRSQGIIFYQASSYQFCQMYANKAIDESRFVEMQMAALAAAERVLMAEIKAITTIRNPEPVAGTADERRNKIDEQTKLPTLKQEQPPPSDGTSSEKPLAGKNEKNK